MARHTKADRQAAHRKLD